MVVLIDNVVLKLDDVMKEKDITDYKLNELSGITRDNISKIRRGLQIPTLETLGRIGKAIKVNISDLVEFK